MKNRFDYFIVNTPLQPGDGFASRRTFDYVLPKVKSSSPCINNRLTYTASPTPRRPEGTQRAPSRGNTRDNAFTSGYLTHKEALGCCPQPPYFE